LGRGLYLWQQNIIAFSAFIEKLGQRLGCPGSDSHPELKHGVQRPFPLAFCGAMFLEDCLAEAFRDVGMQPIDHGPKIDFFLPLWMMIGLYVLRRLGDQGHGASQPLPFSA
jgi:hypothetical protein